MANADEVELLKKARQGDESAREELYVTYFSGSKQVRGLLAREIENPADREDLLHDAYLSLVRSGRPDNVVTGILGLTVDGGSTGGTATILDLAALTPGKQRELPFNFRFYQNFDQEIAIPAGFKPEHLAVEVHSSRKDVAPLVQTFPWSLEPAP